MINLTAAAVEKVTGILDQEKDSLPNGGLRIYVQGGGCSGVQYGMTLDQANDADQVFEKHGIKVIVDPVSLRYLDGAEVDFRADAEGGAFAIKNPNAASCCGCGQTCPSGDDDALQGGGGND